MRKKLVEKRKSKKFTQRKMAEKLGISLSFYIKIEQDKRNPGLELAQKIAELLDSTVDELFFHHKRHAECHDVIPTGTNG